MKAKFTLGVLSSISRVVSLAAAGGAKRWRRATVPLAGAVVIALAASVTWFIVLEREAAAKATWLIVPRAPASFSNSGGGGLDCGCRRVAVLE